MPNFQVAIIKLLVLICVIVCFFSAIKGQDEDAEIVSVESALVVLNAKITDRSGRHVPGLTKSLFSIFEDGTKQEIKFFQAEETPFAAIILLDTSGSMGQNISLARAAAIRFLDGIRQSDAVAIYRFDSKVKLVQEFSNSRDVSENIFDLKSEGMTVLNDAVFLAATELANRPEKRKAIIVLSDGADTMSGRSADRALKAALLANAVIYTVDMAPAAQRSAAALNNRSVLKSFAEKSGGTFVASPGGVALRDAFASVVEELGVQYTIGYQPSNDTKDGKWRTVELRVARPNLLVRTRQGYATEKSNR
jgi:Ca-activated chloride channel homolog